MYRVYDEPTARWHILKGRKISPDKKRPDYVDWRIIITKCGMTIALVADPKNRPRKITECRECYED